VLHTGEARTIAMRLPRGAVITGSVTDGDGQPVPGALVAAFVDRFEPTTSARRLRLTEGATTDDRGEYRIFGLPAGQYAVYAQVTTAFDAKVVKRTTSDTRSVVTANTYYPSTPDGTRATRITVAAGEERSGIDIQVQYVPTASVEGVVSGGNGSSDSVVMLLRSNEPMSASLLAAISPIAPDGQFTFRGVAPGRYELRTQSPSAASPSGGSADRPWMWGSTDVVVDGDDVMNVGIQLMPTFTISGRVVFEGATPAPPLGSVSLPALISSTIPNRVPLALRLLDGGKFMMSGLMPGAYRPAAFGSPMRGVQSPIGGWWLKSITIDGRELLDAPLELRQASENAIVTFSDQASEVAGSVKDGSGAPVARGYVVIFSSDRAHWFVNSRRVVALAPDARGRYSIRNLPPGDYRAAVALDLEQGEWFDPDVLQSLLPTAVALTITGVEAKTLDLVLR
jgi:protocatechuate 3,4-dioxygenase beta subunit